MRTCYTGIMVSRKIDSLNDMPRFGLLSLLVMGCLSCSSPLSQQVHETFLRNKDSFTVTLFPVRIFRGQDYVHNPALSRVLGELLAAENLATPTVSDDMASFPISWRNNQKNQFLLHARSYADAVKKRRLSTDYALFSEIYCNLNESRVVAVHYYLIDSKGRLADGQFINSRHSEFLILQPRNHHDGFELLSRLIRKQWSKRTKDQP